MKYIWDLMARANAQEIPHNSLTFIPAKNFSPYLEISMENLNDTQIPEIIEVNPYYRFLPVFNDYFKPDYHDDECIREELFNLIIHYLANLDTYMGMTKREYEIILTIEDIKNGTVDPTIKDDFGKLFTISEQKIIGNNFLKHHTLNEGIYLFGDCVKKLYKKATIYGNLTEKDELLVHLLVGESDIHKARLNVLKQLFLPEYCDMELYWIFFCGIVGIDVAMTLDEMVMY